MKFEDIERTCVPLLGIMTCQMAFGRIPCERMAEWQIIPDNIPICYDCMKRLAKEVRQRFEQEGAQRMAEAFYRAWKEQP
jgi:hypothetical protein